jgi:phospholipase A1
MKYLIIQLKRFAQRSVSYLSIVAVMLTGLVTPGFSQADDMAVCMAEMMEKASDSTTVGELRAQCSQEIQDSEIGEQESEFVVVDDRLKKDKENVLQPFTLMAHKSNYFLVGAYNDDGYNSEPFQQQFGDPGLQFDDFEAQFQISLKVPLGVGLFKAFDVYAGYTNRSFWQVHSSEISSPFRETNHEPEAWVQFAPGWKILGFKNLTNSIGVVHQSNGRGGVLSRSWNRVYANFVFGRGNFAVGFKPWFRISEDADVDDNPDITDYLGHYELKAGYKWNDHVFSLMSRNNLESGFRRGAVELGWSFPLWKYQYLKGYIQYFRGYGESLIDYNQRVNRIGLGISLTDWL